MRIDWSPRPGMRGGVALRKGGARNYLRLLKHTLPEAPQFLDERNDILPFRRVLLDLLLCILVELQSVGLQGGLGGDRDSRFTALLLFLAALANLLLHELLLSQLLRGKSALSLLLFVELVQASAPFFPEGGEFVLLGLLAVGLRPLALHLHAATRVDLLQPLPPALLSLQAIHLVHHLLLEDLPLQTLVLVRLHRGELRDLLVNHLLLVGLLRLEDFLLALLAELEDAFFAQSVFADLLLLALVAELVLRAKLLQIRIRFLRLGESLNGLLATLLLSEPLTAQILCSLLPQHLALQNVVLDLPETLVSRFLELAFLHLRSHLRGLAEVVLLAQLALEHVAVARLLHFQIPLVTDLLELAKLLLQSDLRLPLSEYVAEHHLAVERLHAIGFFVQNLVRALDGVPSLLHRDRLLLLVDLLALQLFQLQSALLVLLLFSAGALKSVRPSRRTLLGLLMKLQRRLASIADGARLLQETAADAQELRSRDHRLARHPRGRLPRGSPA